jgi:hypothetical protein
MSVLTRLSEAVIDAILSPALWLSVTVAIVCSVVFYGLRGGGIRQFGRDVVASLIGFGAGELAGTYLQIDLLRLGQVLFLAGIAGAIGGLFVGRLVWREGAKVT